MINPYLPPNPEGFQLPEDMELIKDLRCPFDVYFKLSGTRIDFINLDNQTALYVDSQLIKSPKTYCFPKNEYTGLSLIPSSIMSDIPNNFGVVGILSGTGIHDSTKYCNQAFVISDIWDYKKKRFMSRYDVRAFCNRNFLPIMPECLVHSSEVNESLAKSFLRGKLFRGKDFPLVFHSCYELMLDKPPHRAVFEWSIDKLRSKEYKDERRGEENYEAHNVPEWLKERGVFGKN